MDKPMLVILLLLKIFMVATRQTTVCSSLENFSQLEQDAYLLDAQFRNTSTGSLLKCVEECQMYRRCASFNFDTVSGLCIMNEKTKNESLATDLINIKDYVFSDINVWLSKRPRACAEHNCSKNQVCEELNGTQSECVTMFCGKPPAVSKGEMIGENPDFWNINESVSYNCSPGFEPLGERLCQSDGSWSAFTCQRVVTCADLKACNNDYIDGEYWFRAKLANYPYVKVYCSGMATTSPESYITLFGENYSYFLDTDNEACSTTWSGTFEGNTTFSKVKFNPWNFSFLHGGFRFAMTSGLFGNFGRTVDCRDSLSCAAKEAGSFRIDTTRTGLKVVDYLKWTDETTVTRSSNGNVITGSCRARCLYCKPTGSGFGAGAFSLEYDTSFVPDNTTAIFPVCKQ
ncbi:uncharacterized protein LOC124112289 [Haliotis rufescens]|uniref:uncharacterized protein LOC124112289 n=1 Tax=Haliotis rufescens TaxID=6454 RepID=UPI00201EA005|nr:uncharacterized protein LOC124112289 [Haliotis rufescens]